MFKLTTLLLLCTALAVAIDIPNERPDYHHAPATSADFVDEINNMASNWEAHVSPRFQGMTVKDAKRMCGVLPKPKNYTPLPEKSSPFAYEVDALPTNFDGRVQWGTQCPSLNDVRDQGGCGSCWAMAAAEAITDRFCIASINNQKYDNVTNSNPRLSAQELVSCCNGFTCFGCQGCNGGQVEAPWSYYAKKGLVSGFLYEDKDTCFPYAQPPCEHHVSGPRPTCTEGDTPTPSCSKKCTGNTSLDWTEDKRFGKQPYALNGVEKIMQDIYEHGPVECAFTVYQDFLSYKSGVYKHTTGPAVGGHAVKIIGWGVENGEDYWLITNSWNSDWGDNGFFKILKGANECGIESNVVGGQH